MLRTMVNTNSLLSLPYSRILPAKSNRKLQNQVFKKRVRLQTLRATNLIYFYYNYEIDYPSLKKLFECYVYRQTIMSSDVRTLRKTYALLEMGLKSLS